ncbi:poly [ADP-ribose] polymerase tankyrase-2-like [Contarinia nasturtii]|uniref:poly [ADP-ribose] polymerase tankyrase-2-like n=1 Tax=Contarinia nasturtii TaxID=265458 RepID=UPI0012D41F08|nr:poly [ADP-ribose] polymerase tankyrase-2-like [Contarinia nasturtii]XP_031627755.1 poly [ADP-ribose] polymerase tankyrase-2-like [Contarinia nasturtii]
MISLFTLVFCAGLTLIAGEENVLNSTKSSFDFSVVLTNFDQQLLEALHEKLDERSDMHDKLNFLRVANESIESFGNVTTLQQRIKQYSALILNLNITSVNTSALHQIEQEQTTLPDEILTANSSSAINFVSSEYICYKDAIDLLGAKKEQVWTGSFYDSADDNDPYRSYITGKLVDRTTPLHEAVKHNNLCVVELLITQGANVNARADEGMTPIFEAAKTGNKDVAELLIKHGASVKARKTYSETPLLVASENGNKDVVELLIENGGAEIGRKSLDDTLFKAVENGNKDVVELLIKHGADIHASDTWGYTPLHSAAKYGNKDAVEVLIKHRAYVNAQTEYGKVTPLHQAAENGNKDVVEFLIKHGANVYATNYYKETPLHEAAEYGNTEAIEVLLRYGAQIYATDAKGRTPFDVAKGDAKSFIQAKIVTF